MKPRVGVVLGTTILIGFALVSVLWAQESETASSEAKIEKTVVTATRTEVSLKDAPGAITIITAEDIKDMPANDILDVVRETAGISLIGRGTGGRSVISVRGLNSWHSLILVDGKRVAASDPVFGHSDFEQNWIPLESIERIEVVRGPLSALYGSEAIGGVINVITKKSTDEWRGSARIGGGVPDDGTGGENQSYAGYASGPIIEDRLGIALTAEYIKDEDTEDEDDPRYSELEGKRVFSGGGTLTFAASDDHTFEAGFFYTDDYRWRYTTSRGNDYRGDFELEKSNYHLDWKGKIGPTRSIVKLYRSEIEKDNIIRYENGAGTTSPEQLANDVADAQTTFSLGVNLVTLGGEYRREELESTTLLQGEDNVAHYALFAQDEIALFDGDLLLTPGVRWDDHETFGSEVSPRLYALYKLASRINLKAGYGHAFRAPTVKQVSEGFYSASGPHEFFGNPDLGPETSDAYEGGIEYFDDGIFARVLFYHNDIDDLIDWERIGSSGRGNQYRAVNIDEAETKGVEAEAGIPLPYGFELSGAYTYLDAKDTGDDVRLDGKPRHVVNGKLEYESTEMGFSAALRVQYIADQVLYNDDDELEEAPDYSLWHVSARKTLFRNFELQAGVENIGDVRLADKSDLFDYEERGRFYYANLRYAF